MLKGRRVGTLTAGTVLIVFGVLFLLRLVFPTINFSIIASLWPIILILLGVEILISYMVNKEEKMKYDTGAIFLVIVLSFFSMGMALVELTIKYQINGKYIRF